MKYIITERQNTKIITKYLNNEYGDLKERRRTDKNPNSIYFFKENKVYMAYGSSFKDLWVDYYTIWTDLEKIFDLTENEIKRIITKWVEDTYGLSGVKIYIAKKGSQINWEEALKMSESEKDDVIKNYLDREYGDLKKYTTDKYPDNIFFIRDKKVYMELDSENMDLWVDYETIWKSLEDLFKLSRREIVPIVNKWMKKTYGYDKYSILIPQPTESSEMRWKDVLK